jgi:CRISPR type I-E-associated protein CasB/Cse2
MSKPDERTNPAKHFMTRLRAMRNDRGSMASLRRGLSPATRHQAWPVLARIGGDIAQIAPMIVGGLFATHPVEDTSHSLGDTCRRIGATRSKRGNDERETPEERRFRRLIASDSIEDASRQILHWIRLAASAGVGVNYEQLYWDFLRWDKDSDAVKLRWARDFYSPRKGDKESAVVGNQEEPTP